MASRAALRRISAAVYLAEPVTAGTAGAASTTHLQAGNQLANGSAASAGARDPRMVLLCTWMGAQLKHAEKYVDAYRKLYPESTVLLVRSNPIDFFRRAAFLEAIRPAADLLRARSNGQTGSTSDLLVHTLSNGGCLTLQELNEQLRKNASASGSAQPATIPARAFIYDSCPGLSTLTSTIRAFSAGLRNPLVFYPAVAAITVMYGVLRFWTIIRRQPSTLARISAYLNSPALPPVPRLYLYSDIDELIPPEDVERHAAEAKSKAGVRHVTMEMFAGSPHVAHARTDPARYWNAVKQVWEESGSQTDKEKR